MRVGIVGATGYTGLELLRLLAQHPSRPEVSVITSRQESGQALPTIFPELSAQANYDQLRFEAPEADELAGRADVFFLATPHGTAMSLVPALLDKGARVIDLSADFRLRDKDIFNQWYQPHSAPEFLAGAVYGLPELYADKIRSARLVANPGCYPTSVILGATPFLAAGLLDGDRPIIVNSCSGVSGAGRSAALGSSFCEVHDSFKAYKVVGHRHTPEIEQELSAVWGKQLRISFTPHLVPMSRGILSTICLSPNRSVSQEELRGIYEDYYRDKPFVRVRPTGFEPQTSEVRGTNFCDISLFYDSRTNLVKIIAVIDNLCRGASGQALVNFNLISGLPETSGLLMTAIRP